MCYFVYYSDFAKTDLHPPIRSDGCETYEYLQQNSITVLQNIEIFCFLVSENDPRY